MSYCRHQLRLLRPARSVDRRHSHSGSLPIFSLAEASGPRFGSTPCALCSPGTPPKPRSLPDPAPVRRAQNKAHQKLASQLPSSETALPAPRLRTRLGDDSPLPSTARQDEVFCGWGVQSTVTRVAHPLVGLKIAPGAGAYLSISPSESEGSSVRQQTPKCCHSRNQGLCASISSCFRLAAEMSLALRGRMSGASNISCSCSMSSMMRSTSMSHQYPTEAPPRSNTNFWALGACLLPGTLILWRGSHTAFCAVRAARRLPCETPLR